MAKFTFKVKQVTVPSGGEYVVLTSNEYPYMNIQIVPTPEGQRDEIIRKLNDTRWVVAVWGRYDFVAIHAGGGKRVKLTQGNYKDVVAAMKECLIAGAAWWAQPDADKPEAVAYILTKDNEKEISRKSENNQ